MFLSYVDAGLSPPISPLLLDLNCHLKRFSFQFCGFSSSRLKFIVTALSKYHGLVMFRATYPY